MLLGAGIKEARTTGVTACQQPHNRPSTRRAEDRPWPFGHIDVPSAALRARGSFASPWSHRVQRSPLGGINPPQRRASARALQEMLLEQRIKKCRLCS